LPRSLAALERLERALQRLEQASERQSADLFGMTAGQADGAVTAAQGARIEQSIAAAEQHLDGLIERFRRMLGE
jgi:hypothetical protein